MKELKDLMTKVISFVVEGFMMALADLENQRDYFDNRNEIWEQLLGEMEQD